jgi:two-component system vancomycin resistance associated response regulator VraR
VSEPNKTIRVLIAEDHPVVRAGIRAALKKAPDIEVVGEARDGVEAEQMVTELRPNVLLLDLVMPGLRPLEIEKWVRAHYPETLTLILTAHDRDCYLKQAIEAGVVGYLTKEEPLEKLVEAIRRAVRGEVLITGGQMARAYSWRKEVGEQWERLTQRERQIFALMVRGQSTQQIAEALTLSKCTVRTHIGNILGKLGFASRAEAIAWAWQHGIIEVMDSSG